jgi:hypothetical protein
MVTVVEQWYLEPEMAPRALEIMQEMDELLGPPAHAHPGWCGHAQFLQSQQDPSELLVVYPWRSREQHESLVRDEDAVLEDFNRRYCRAGRRITLFDSLPVEVEHDHEHQAV